jgi:putative membrane protein
MHRGCAIDDAGAIARMATASFANSTAALATRATAMGKQARAWNAWLCVFIALYVLLGAARLLHNSDLQRLSPFISVSILIGFAIVHGIRRYGWTRFVVFFLVAFVVSWSYETVSILTGFPFGHYVYTDKLGPKLWLVPLLIMPAYFSMGYIAWTLGHVLLDRFDDRLVGAEVVLVPALASFVMVMWDLCIDPASSTISGAWIWRDGGGYFGVPLVNFLGWYLCVFTIYLVFALYLRRSAEWPRAAHLGERSTWALPAVMYAAVMLPRLIEPLAGGDSVEVTSHDGHVWWTGDIHAAAAVVALFTMLFVTVLALVRVSRSPALH